VRLDCGSCVVRDWVRADKASLLRFGNDRRVWRNLLDRFPHPYTDEHAEGWFALLEAMPEPTHWAIDVDGKAVGGIGVDLGKGMFAKTAEFGYWIAEPYWGRGIATAAVQRVAPFALEHFKLARLESPVFGWNPASMRVLEKCGFQREGVLRRSIVKDGELIDQVLYARVT
jgi:RimJ/RimL family protein N-acetyltransferase